MTFKLLTKRFKYISDKRLNKIFDYYYLLIVSLTKKVTLLE